MLAGKLLASLVWVFSVNVVSVLEISLFTGAGHLLRLDLLVLLLLEAIGLLSIGNLFFARKASGSSTSLDLVPMVVTLALPLVFLSMEISQVTVRNVIQTDLTSYFGLLVAYVLFLVTFCSLFYRTLADE